jgi:hypothetical protein
VRSFSPSSSSSSVGKGPEPTRVVYALTIPITRPICVGPIPEPVQAPPAVGFDDLFLDQIPPVSTFAWQVGICHCAQKPGKSHPHSILIHNLRSSLEICQWNLFYLPGSKRTEEVTYLISTDLSPASKY